MTAEVEWPQADIEIMTNSPAAWSTRVARWRLTTLSKSRSGATSAIGHG